MERSLSSSLFRTMAPIAAVSLLSGLALAQNQQPPAVAQAPPPALARSQGSLPPRNDPATVDQIREYLKLSGDLESFRKRWIDAVDENRSIGAPYWPESFWTALKAEMRQTDLMPMFITLYQHGVSKELMQEVLDTYHREGADHFQGTPACFKLGNAWLALADDMDKLKLAKTQEVAMKIYDIYKPQIKAARVKYMAEHPDWRD